LILEKYVASDTSLI